MPPFFFRQQILHTNHGVSASGDSSSVLCCHCAKSSVMDPPWLVWNPKYIVLPDFAVSFWVV